MSTLLHIDASPLETWKTAHPNGRVIYRDLAAHIPSAIDQAWIGSSYTPPDARTTEQKARLLESEELVDELFAADEVVIGIPMHNFSIPSSLKLWVDQVVRSGRTFRYDANGPEGLLKGKIATLLIATGGDYAQGSPAASMNFIEPYMRTILGFLGISDAKLMTGAVDRETLLLPALTRIRAGSLSPAPVQ
jgi:FMN-dependent NADH-azoreductase